MAPYGYIPSKQTPGLWTHKSNKIAFCLCVDDFGIRYTNPAAAYHLIKVLKKQYEIAEDWSGSRFCGITLKWDYQERSVVLSIPGYVQNALKKFQHNPPARAQYSPHPVNPIQYGPIQYAEQPEQPTNNAEDVKTCQQIIGTFLYYARAVDGTMLPALNSLSEVQTSPTPTTMKNIKQLLDYAATNPNAGRHKLGIH